MASNLACVGLPVTDEDEFHRLVDTTLAAAHPAGDGRLLVWQDPSGVRMAFSMSDTTIDRLLPTFAGEPGARLTDVRRVTAEVAVADVVSDGETVTRLAIELETGPVAGQALAGTCSVIALGNQVTLHASVEAFAADDASLLGDPGRAEEPAPPEYAERGWSWPPRMAAESFMPYGMFAEDPEAVSAHAWLSGVVLRAERRTVELTGQHIVVARIRTVGFEADLCVPADVHPGIPAPGTVIAGEVFLTGSLVPD